MTFTDAEKQVILTFLASLTPQQLLQRFLNVIPGLVGTSDPGIALMISSLSAKSSLLQSNLDGLDAQKTAQQTAITAQKTVIDGLLVKLTS